MTLTGMSVHCGQTPAMPCPFPADGAHTATSVPWPLSSETSLLPATKFQPFTSSTNPFAVVINALERLAGVYPEMVLKVDMRQINARIDHGMMMVGAIGSAPAGSILILAKPHCWL